MPLSRRGSQYQLPEDDKVKEVIEDRQRTECPYITANWLSRLTIWWLTPLIRHGYRTRLETSDIYDVLPWEKSKKITDDLERAWETSQKKEIKGTLLGTQLRLYRTPILVSGVLRVLLEAIKLVMPVLIGYILNYLQGTGTISLAEAYLCAAGIVFLTILHSLPYTLTINVAWGVGMRGRAALTGLVYKKMLKLSLQSLQECTSGRIITYLATDVETISLAGRFINYMWLSPLILVTVIVLLLVEFGKAFLFGCGTLVILLVVEISLGLVVGKLKMKVSKWTDKRNSVMTEILGGIQMIKTFCWESSFSSLVEENRGKELKTLLRGRLLESQLNSIFFLANKIVSFVTILSAVLMDYDVTPAQALKMIGWLELARTMMFGLFPLGVVHTMELYQSMIRIQKFLELPEKGSQSTPRLLQTALDILDIYRSDSSGTDSAESVAAAAAAAGDADIAETDGYDRERDKEQSAEQVFPKSEADKEGRYELKEMKAKKRTRGHRKFKVILEDAVIGWFREKEADEDVKGESDHLSPGKVADKPAEGIFKTSLSLRVRKGELLVIIGEVGSGKTSLLMALLGELPLAQGSLTIDGSVAYVPQEPWVMSDTLKENIMMGQGENTKYDDVIEACELVKDVNMMPLGELTKVGERGWRLSGGQKTRVNLARAVYADADIYLLDDPLSAVDAKVGRNIFDRCIKGILKKKTRILVTHQLQYLNEADRIIILSQGQIQACGTFDEIKDTDVYQRVSFTDSAYKRSQKIDLTSHIQEFSTETGLEESADFLRELEEREEGRLAPHDPGRSRAIGWKVWLQYLKSGKGEFLLVLFSFILAITLVAYIGCDWLCVRWCTINTQQTSIIAQHQSRLDHIVEDNNSFLRVWGVLLAILLLTSNLQSIVIYGFSVLASRILHRDAFRRVMKAPLYFFESNPIGRILNRFSRDVSFMDMALPRTLYILVSGLALMLAQIVFIVVVDPWLLLATVPIVILGALLRHYSLAAMRDLRRIEALRRAPTYSLIMDSIRGLPVLRSLKREDHFMEEFHRLQDRHTGAWFLFFNAYRWLGVRTELLLAGFMMICLVVGIATRSLNLGESGAVGLGLTYLTFTLANLQMLLIYSADMNTMMTSVERIHQYTTLPQEAPDHTDVTPPSEWPSEGVISMQNMSLQYNKGPYALTDISVKIRSKEKVGIVGRTGAGKSSLMKCILRLEEPQGRVLIDGVDITQLGLYDLRENISVIPQDPIFLAGTLRKNLDPFLEYSDGQLWQVLEQVHMKTTISHLDGGLWCEVFESGTNFSVGEKQLLCLARALLRKKAILLVDEATANVDRRTDALVQTTVRKEFADSTVLTIAHRLDTIMDSDRVLVLQEGQIVGYDHPHLLLQDTTNYFYQLVEQSGTANMQKLREMAEDSYARRRH